MPEINSINNNFAASTTLQKLMDLDKNKETFTKALDGATAPKYGDLAELQASGNSSVYNQAFHDVVMKKVYDTANTSVGNALSNQAFAIKNIRDIIEEFKESLPAIT